MNLLEQAGSNVSHYNLDIYWKPLQLKDKWYVSIPKIGKQIISYSDNEYIIVNTYGS
jgi:hypothetical protein